MPKVGFIGIGAMGAPMSRNIARAGFPLVVYDVRREVLEPLQRECDAAVASSPLELAKTAEVVITMLPSTAALKEVIYGEQGVLPAMDGTRTLIEMSTLGVDLVLQVGKELQHRGARLIDAPVGGLPEMAATGDLEILASGSKEVVDSCRGILEAMGKTVIYVGKLGNGKIIKLTNNLLILLNKFAGIEAMSAALKHGIDPELMLQIMKKSGGNSVTFERFGQAMVGYDTPAGKRHSWHLKDLELMLELCKQSDTPLFFGELAHRLLASSIEEAGGVENLEAMVSYYKKAMSR